MTETLSLRLRRGRLGASDGWVAVYSALSLSLVRELADLHYARNIDDLLRLAGPRATNEPIVQRADWH